MIQDKKRALFIAHKLFAELVFDMSMLEGMPFSMPEVQTYLQGVTIGGHKVSDIEKPKQHKLGWELNWPKKICSPQLRLGRIYFPRLRYFQPFKMTANRLGDT